MSLFTDIAEGVGYSIKSFHEKATAERASALKLAALRLRCLEQSLADCQGLAQACAACVQQVAEQLGQEVGTLNRMAPPDQPSLKLPVDTWRTLYSAGSHSKKALSTGILTLRTGLFLGELRRLSFSQMLTSAPATQSGIEMVVIGAANRPVTTVAGVAELSVGAQWVKNLSTVARYFGMFMTAFELFMSARSIAQMEEVKRQLDQYARDADEHLQQVERTFEQMVSQMRTLYMPLSSQDSEGDDVLNDGQGNTLLLALHFSRILQVPSKLAEHLHGGETPEVISEQRLDMQRRIAQLIGQAGMAKAVLIQQSQERLRESVMRESQARTAVRGFIKGMSVEQMDGIVSLPLSLLEQLKEFARVAVDYPATPLQLETTASGDWLVRMPA